MKFCTNYILFVMIIGGLLTCGGVAFAQSTPDNNSTNYNFPIPDDKLEFEVNTSEGQKIHIDMPPDQLIFNIIPHFDQNGRVKSFTMTQKPELVDLYKKLGYGNNKDKAFIYPIFTQAAYSQGGFYDYYNKKCNTTCLTIPIPDKIKGTYSSSIAGAFVLTLLGYSQLTDIDVDKNPNILKQFKRVIVLHNEYVTKKEFDAITSHSDVVFLYPNALYAQVKTDYDVGTITLIRGHGYPDKTILNGFDWKRDNSKHEYNVQCDDWTYYRNENYSMMNCYPEYRMLRATEMLQLLQVSDPTQLPEDVANWVRYPMNQNYTKALLSDYDLRGTFLPQWVREPAIMMLNEDITKTEFLNILDYLNKNNIVK